MVLAGSLRVARSGGGSCTTFGMTAATYSWVCHSCGAKNEPGLCSCTSCGCRAVASAEEINEFRTTGVFPPPKRPPKERGISDSQFFPEIIIAGLAAIIAPFWAMSLAFQGRELPALLLSLGTGVSVYGFFFFLRRRRKTLAYFSMFAVIAVAFVVHALVS